MKNKPTYDLDKVKQIALDGERLNVSGRTLQWLANHGYPDYETVQNIVLSLKEAHFYKSDELVNIPGMYGDIYQPEYDGEIWYVKLFLSSLGNREIVRVWTCCLDGFIH